ALIGFLVFEKEVLTMQDDTNELDLYFQKQHQERMNKELHAYKQKTKLKKRPSFYRVKTHKKTFYVKVMHEHEIAELIKSKILDVQYLSEDLLMDNGKKLHEITE